MRLVCNVDLPRISASFNFRGNPNYLELFSAAFLCVGYAVTEPYCYHGVVYFFPAVWDIVYGCYEPIALSMAAVSHRCMGACLRHTCELLIGMSQLQVLVEDI